jgi:AraC-like DNA-binding protein
VSEEPRIAAFVFAPVLAGMADLGIDVRALQCRAGIPQLDRCEPKLRIPYSAAVKLWDLVVEATGDPAIGLRVAKTVRLDQFDLIAYLARSSASIRDAMRDIDRYGALLADGIRFVLRDDGRAPKIAIEFGGPGQPHPAGSDYGIGVLFEGIRREQRGLAVPVEVHFHRAEPADPRPYKSFFGVPVRFSQPHNAIVLQSNTRLSALALPGSDAGLHDVLERAAQQTLRSDESDEALERRLRDAIRIELPNGRPGVDALAARLRIGERSLRRRLSARGNSVSGIVDEVRLELATRYLGEAQMSLAETSRSLGFSEPSAFHRAFRRWTGMTPRAFARKHSS